VNGGAGGHGALHTAARAGVVMRVGVHRSPLNPTKAIYPLIHCWALSSQKESSHCLPHCSFPPSKKQTAHIQVRASKIHPKPTAFGGFDEPMQ
jgi:hypothetical protein